MLRYDILLCYSVVLSMFDMYVCSYFCMHVCMLCMRVCYVRMHVMYVCYVVQVRNVCAYVGYVFMYARM